MMKNSNSRKTSKKYVVIAVCLALALAAGTIAVFAYLSGKSGAVNNTLKADVDPSPVINETILPTSGPGYPVKENVSVSVGDNDYTVYVRAAIVVNWVKDEYPEDETDDTVTTLIHSDVPVLNTDYTLDLNLPAEGAALAAGQWRLGSDGFYYYTSPVAGGADTAVLIKSATQIWNGQNPYPVRDDGYVLRVEIAAQTIQAIGTTDSGNKLAVVDAWGVTTTEVDGVVLITK